MSEIRHKEGLALALLILEYQPASAAHGGEAINLQLPTALNKRATKSSSAAGFAHLTPSALSARAAIRGFLPKS